jgi:hypothetical protein
VATKAAINPKTDNPSIKQGEVVKVLEQIWEIYGRIYSMRLHPCLPEGIKVLEGCGEIIISAETKALLL